MFGTCNEIRNFRQFPAEARRSADAAVKEREKRLRKITEKHSSQAAKLSAKAGDRLRRLLGDDNWADLRDLMRQERLTFRDLLQPPEGLTASYDKLNRARKQKADAFLRSRDIRRDELVAIGTEYHEAIADVFTAGENIRYVFSLR